MENQIDENIKKERVKNLISLSNELEIKYLDSFMSNEVEVLIETNDELESIGHTGNYLKVIIDEKLPSNQLVTVKIIERDGTTLKGTLV